MAEKTIYLIDDDEKLNALLVEYLARFEFKVQTFTQPKKGLDALADSQPSLIILDVMLPGMDGFEVCRRIRKKYQTPVIMLTARGEVTDRIVGLEIGADDYIPKPFEPRELVARIQTVLRRGSGNSSPTQKAELFVDLARHSAQLREETVELTTAEFEILQLFIRNKGRVLSRDQITDRVRGIGWEAFDRSVDVLISRLRQKLKDDPKDPQYIKTIWGSGYMFIGEVDYEDQ